MNQKYLELNQRLNKINKNLSEKAAKYNFLIDRKKDLLFKIKDLTHKEKVMYEASLLLREACNFSRIKMKKDIETVVGNSLKDIFGDPTMGFEIKYDSSHNKPVADFYITKIINNKTIHLDIMNESGGGVADIVALSIRVVLLLYHSNKITKILLLDEACTSISNFSGEVLTNLGKWIKTICEKFDIQIILVTQKTELASFAHKIFKVESDIDGTSKVSLE